MLSVVKLWKNVVAIHKSNVKLMFKKQHMFGMFILDLSKVLMYHFHYDYDRYGKNSKFIN